MEVRSQGYPARDSGEVARIRYNGRNHDSAVWISANPLIRGEALRKQRSFLATSDDTVTDGLKAVVDGFA
jgi:hypothetical protein